LFSQPVPWLLLGAGSSTKLIGARSRLFHLAAFSSLYFPFSLDRHRSAHWRARLNLCDKQIQMGSATIFVYGTLKRGCRNHPVLKGAEFLGEARTEPGYCLVHCGSYPGLVKGLADPAGLMDFAASEGVFGELYRVDAALLAELDRFEDVPHEYERAVIRLSGDAEAQAYLYSGETAQLPLCGPRWEER
jgi:gamma-glutamylcyclotransferase (GGCT)/AIG2-like uncharacterized protein YtfP